MKVRNQNSKLIIILIAITALFTVTFLIFVHYHIQSRASAFEDYNRMLGNQYRITTSAYADMAELIFTTNVNTPEVKQLFAEGLKCSDEIEKNRLREQLYDELSDLYSKINNYNFRQLHFHDKNNISYLRFHRPEKFGDDLTGIRYSVEYANREKTKISGFEEGRIFNGYRYVFPLSYQNEHLGTVEISISVKTIIDHIALLFEQKSQLILLKSQMEKKVFASEYDNYTEWHIDNRYLLDVGISEKCILGDQISETEISYIKSLINEYSESSRPFSAEIDLGYKKSVISFLPISNFLDENVAYLISLSSNSKIEDIRHSFIIISIIYIGLYLLMLILAGYYVTSKNKIERITQIDHLTKSDTRKVLLEKIDGESHRFIRYKRPFSIIMIDIDHFKNINDTYGHLKGDEVLRGLSELIQKNLRETDSFGRYGGEEFIILLPETNLSSAAGVAEALRKKIEEHRFLESETVTISMGIAEAYVELENIDDIIEKADQKLYKAKESGRNKVCY